MSKALLKTFSAFRTSRLHNIRKECGVSSIRRNK